MAEPERCQDSIRIEVPHLDRTAHVYVRCERLVVNAAGRKVEHIHHRRTHDIPGVERAMTTWVRRP